MDSNWKHNPRWNGDFSWSNTAFVVLSPVLMLAMLPYVVIHSGLSWWDFAIFSVMIFTTGFSLTVGYHRLFAHQTFEVHPAVRFFFLFFGAGCVENSAIQWSSDHRYHHRFVDKEGDPYNINKGFFYAHMGWIFKGDPPGRSFDNARDLLKDPMAAWQHKYYLPLSLFVSFVIPTALGLAVGRPLAGFFWGGLFRLLFLQHGTFLINSACHKFGRRPYSTKVTARDCWWLAFFTNGEAYHNFHHAFGSDYRNGLNWYHWDPSKWMISTLEAVGLAHGLKRTPDPIILKARLETAIEEFRRSWKDREIPDQLEQMRATIDRKLQEFQLKVREFQAWKETAALKHERSRRGRSIYWKRKLRTEKRALEAALAEFREKMQKLEMQASQPAYS